jgi:Predicted metal-binding protein
MGIDGHVPAASVQRLLAERPDIQGLAVAGDADLVRPGMEIEGVDPDPFVVVERY